MARGKSTIQCETGLEIRAKTYAKANRKIVEIYVFFEGHYQIKLV